MFKNNKYTKWYFSIINNALKYRELEYSELHHIIPKCLGGSNEVSNLVRLSAREHFICHYLLTKMHDSEKLKFSIVMMLSSNSFHARYIVNSRTFEMVRKLNSDASKIRMIGHVCANIGKVSITNGIRSKYINENADIPNGWYRGISDQAKKNIGISNSGKVYYNNGIDTIAVDTDVSPPLGYMKGSLTGGLHDGKRFIDTHYSHNPITMEEVREKYTPDGWVTGRLYVWITDGNDRVLHNKYQIIPEGWVAGVPFKKQEKYGNKPISTPLGKFTHPLRFCEKYDIDVSFFYKLDIKIKNKKRYATLLSALQELGINLTLTKEEMGFKYE